MCILLKMIIYMGMSFVSCSRYCRCREGNCRAHIQVPTVTAAGQSDSPGMLDEPLARRQVWYMYMGICVNPILPL